MADPPSLGLHRARPGTALPVPATGARRTAREQIGLAVLAVERAGRGALARMVNETVAAWHGRKSSPIYHLLPFLTEPDLKTLRIGGVQEVWEQFADWARRVETARSKQRAGDVIVLAQEAPAQA